MAIQKCMKMCTELKVNKAITTYPASRPRNSSSRNARQLMSVLYRWCPPIPKGKALSCIGDDSFSCSSLCSPPVHISPNIIFSVLAGFYTTYKYHVEYFFVSCFTQRKINPGGSQVSLFFHFHCPIGYILVKFIYGTLVMYLM